MRRVRHTSGLSFYEEQSSVNLDILRRALVWVVITALAVFLGVAFTLFFGCRCKVQGSAMTPQLADGQQVLVNRIAYRMASPRDGDVIAYYVGGNTDTAPQIARVIATSDETVQIVDGRLLVNGTPYSSDPIYSDIAYTGIAAQLITLGDDEFFVMGDNPASSEDSRSAGIGAIRESDIIGKVWLGLPGTDGTFGIIE